MSGESIIDASKPNAGRIYDYILGGHHNFEVDRQAAEQVIKLLPFVPKAMRLQRWCLQDLAVELTEKRGYQMIVDFASGLPTQDHLHHVVPPGTIVIYSDRDPIVTQYALEVLQGTLNVYYFQSDARQPLDLLNRKEVLEILRGRRDVALISWGLTTFMSDDELASFAHDLYEWSGPASCWAFNAQGGDVNRNDPGIVRVREIYTQMGTPIYNRSLSRYQELVQPWHPDEKGFISLLTWHGLNESEMTPEERQTWGPGGAGYGAYLIK